ncbi:MAG TPA: ZIP family zinc transporter [Acidobacteriota bacterium]|nr:ZIP family zinc transporter [Acidobacteriota bacterium]
MPQWVTAGGWGLLGGSSLLLGALVGYRARIPPRWIAGVMAFGSGVLISALAFELMDEAFRRGGLGSAATGLLGGAAAFTAATWWLNRRGARHRKRSHGQPSERQDAGSGWAIAAGALLDGIPESLVLGVSMLESGKISAAAWVAVFISNVPEGLASAAGMRKAGRKAGYVFSLWGGICVISGIASALGNALLSGAPAFLISSTMSVAAGAVLAMLVDTMIPEAFGEARDFAGLIAVAGFLVSFAISKS